MNSLVDEMVKRDILSKDNGTVAMPVTLVASGTLKYPLITIIAFGQPFNVSRRRATHEGKPKPRRNLFSFFKKI